ncbi:MAG: MarR family transcriptional regulator [Candidatus Electryonea clarkiae]|nr:MarR family transcriptional regulator [Candidatus Electryonea clarkiae]MDP8289064.1 MarR family transcriptional regulator [Candidatus Electryonea clarkiae]
MHNHFDFDINDRQALVFNVPQLAFIAGEFSGKVGDMMVFNRFDLTTSKYALLMELTGSEHPPKMSDLKDRLFRSPSNLTQSVDSLEKRGLVRRVPSPTDRRAYLIEITEKGTELVKEVNDFLSKQVIDYLSEFDDDELASFAVLLTKFIVRSAGILNIDALCMEKKK